MLLLMDIDGNKENESQTWKHSELNFMIDIAFFQIYSTDVLTNNMLL